MPVGAVPLVEASKSEYSGNMLKAGVVDTLIRESSPMQYMNWLPFQGNALKHTEEVDLPEPEFREVSETYGRTYGTNKEHFWGTTILGGEVVTDNYLIRVQGDEKAVKAAQYIKYAKAMAMKFDKTIVDGTGTQKDFKGWNALIDEGFGQIAYADGAGTAGAALTLDRLDSAKDLMRGMGSGAGMFLNRRTRREITKLARDTSLGYPHIDLTRDNFGRQVTNWGEHPLLIMGDDREGKEILGFDETVGGDDNCASIYIASFGDDGVTGLLGLGGHFEVRDFGEMESQPAHLGRVEVYPGMAVFNAKSLVRIAGILPTAATA